MQPIELVHLALLFAVLILAVALWPAKRRAPWAPPADWLQDAPTSQCTNL